MSPWFVLNLGGLVDAAPDADTPRPSGFELGVGLDQPINHSGTWSVTAEVGAVTYLSPDADQLTTSLGITWSPLDALDLSLTVRVARRR